MKTKKRIRNFNYYLAVILLLPLAFVACAEEEEAFVTGQHIQGKRKNKNDYNTDGSFRFCDAENSYCDTLTFSTDFISQESVSTITEEDWSINVAKEAEMELRFHSTKNNILSDLSIYFLDQEHESIPEKLYTMHYSIHDTEASNIQKTIPDWEIGVSQLLGFAYDNYNKVNKHLTSKKKYGHVGWRTNDQDEKIFIIMYEKPLVKNDYEVVILRLQGDNSSGDGDPISPPFRGTVWYKHINRPEGNENRPAIAHWEIPYEGNPYKQFSAKPVDGFLDGDVEEPGDHFTQMGTFQNLSTNKLKN